MVFFCFKQKTAYERRISDWSSDVCSSDLLRFGEREQLIEFDPGRTFDEAEARGAVGARKDRKIGYQHVDDRRSGERQSAAFAELRRAVARHMIHEIGRAHV